jgi:hypothetical protein
MHNFIEHHPLKLRHLLDYSTANTTKSNIVSQTPRVFCIYESCVSSDMKLPIVSTTDSFEKNELDLSFTYSMLGHLLVQTHNINCTYKRHTFICFRETRKAQGKTDGCTQSPLHSLTVYSTVRGNTLFT